jgi:PadR family transcriptional regulator, regulatory protein AphA
MSRPTLTTSSYVILGLVDLMGSATPYALEGVIRQTVTGFWSITHTQIYSECARLTKDGYLDEEREQTGRRRRFYRLTQIGQEALDAWRAEPPDEPEQTRDPALLKLFFGADQTQIASAQVDVHRRQLEAYEDLADKVGEGQYGGRGAVLKYGLAFERMALEFWTQLAEEAETGEPTDRTDRYGRQLFGPF